MFISNLAEWHYSCRNSFNYVWKNYPQPLTLEEKNLLIKLKKIFIDYLHQFNEHPAIEFIDQKSFFWSKLATIIGRPNSQIIHQAMDKFLPRFNYHYSKLINNMERVRQRIDDLQKQNRSAIDQTAVFYDYIDSDRCNIFLTLSNNANKSAGGMYLHNNNHGFVILEFGDYSASDSIPLANILYHELGHHFQESTHWKNLVAKFAEKVMIRHGDTQQGVTEAINLWNRFSLQS